LAAQTKQPSDKPVDPDAPFVLAVTGTGGPRIAALNAAAEALGLMPGEPLADARAKAGHVQTRAIDSAADDAALRRLALWATRYTPTASPWGEENGADGFFLDIEGAAHLFGGEEKLLADLAFRLDKNFGLPARLAVADTAGMAWALARFAGALSPVLPSGREAQALAPLPVEALRLSPDTCRTLRRLGFKTVGALLDKPRAPFAARFPAELLRRIDQALGRSEEPLVPIVAPPVYHTLRYLLEPLLTQEAIVALARRLMATLAQVLARDDVGARSLRLSLYRVDGAVETIDIALTLPSRDVAHIVRLIDLRLEKLAAVEDAGFGFEAVGLAVTRAETIAARQSELTSFPSPASGEGSGWGEESGWGYADGAERCAVLVDTLRQRLGPHSVRSFAPVASHIPERAEMLRPAAVETSASGPQSWPRSWPEPEQKPRPLLLLPRAEPTEVLALIPDGPPRRFRWRGITYEVTGSEGPERIASEWWRLDSSAHSRASGNLAADEVEIPGPRWNLPPAPIGGRDARGEALTRDYYLVEDSGGHRFWLYREGLYERETTAARWFVHGLFA
jgi:protein ImuB